MMARRHIVIWAVFTLAVSSPPARAKCYLPSYGFDFVRLTSPDGLTDEQLAQEAMLWASHCTVGGSSGRLYVTCLAEDEGGPGMLWQQVGQ